MSEAKKVLVVDDQKTFRDAVAFEMELLGFEVVTAEDGQQAFDKLQESEFGLIISDIKMPRWTGAKLLQECRSIYPVDPPFILMTGFADLKAHAAFDMGADAFLGKPLHPENLAHAIQLLFRPLPEQLAQESTEPLKVSFKGKPKDLRVGRRGLSFSEPGDLNKSKIGDFVAFDLTGNEHTPFPAFKGVGHLRWMQLKGDQTATMVGIEIVRLETPMPEAFARYVTENHIVPVIPKGLDDLDSATE